MSRLRRRRSRIAAPCPIAWGHNRETGVTNRGGAVLWVGIAKSRSVPTGTYMLNVPTGTFCTGN